MTSNKKQKSQRKKLRVCVGCGELMHKESMLKITVNRLNPMEPILDEQHKIPGRSFYLYPTVECFDRLVSKRRLPKKVGRLSLETLTELLKPKITQSCCLEGAKEIN